MEPLARLVERIKMDFTALEPAAPASIDQMAAELRDYFSKVYPDVDARFALPAEFLDYIALVPQTLRRGDEYGFFLYGLGSVAGSTWIDCNLWAEGHTADLSPWVSIGHWSDRHDFLVCCDPAAPGALFGTVRECNDTHPWLNQETWNTWPTIAAFLTWLCEDDDEG